MIRRFTIVLLMAVISVNCQRNKIPSEGTLIQIDPADSLRKGFSDFFELEKYIVLESSDSSVMREIRKISVINDRIFILTWGDPQILIFNTNGDFISKVDRYGRGPGEYTYAVDMYVAPGGDTITLFDKSLKKLLNYNNKGDFLGEVDLKTDLETFTKLPNGDILGYSFLNHAEPRNDTIYQLWHFSSQGKILSGFLPVKSDYLGNSVGLSSSFNSTSSGLYFIPYTENRVYKISGNPPALTSVYEVDFKGRSIPSDLLALPYKEMQKALFSSYILFGEFIGENNLLFNIYSSEERKLMLTVYNLKTGSYMLTESKNVWDDINELPVEAGQQNFYSAVDRLVAITHPFRLLNHKFKNGGSVGSQLGHKVKETDNPVLLIYKEK
jgi:hypothetical protein